MFQFVHIYLVNAFISINTGSHFLCEKSLKKSVNQIFPNLTFIGKISPVKKKHEKIKLLEYLALAGTQNELV